ncbi:MAG TPA: zf-HC2 domain-containing protein [Candidatus Acidoferrales bacterium]|nr:zf-HC2 domain-containing protein [Candidatus Acidoferrales bacterium]
MAECSEMSLMLGPFEDGELEPNEMQEVAFHLARCDSCTKALGAYSALGRELRTLTPAPQLAGFSATVIARIDKLPQPIWNRVARFFGRGSDFVGSGFAWSSAVAAVAVVTAVLITPYAEEFASRRLPYASSTLARVEHTATALPEKLAQNATGEAARLAAERDAEAVASSDSHAVISRLESDIPSVAVWSEPRTDTTVIWLPDQP